MRTTGQRESKGNRQHSTLNCSKELGAIKPLLINHFLPPAANITLTDFQCSIFLHILDQPVETPCRKLLCADCLSGVVRSIEDATDMTCPACGCSHSITSLSFSPASEVVLDPLYVYADSLTGNWSKKLNQLLLLKIQQSLPTHIQIYKAHQPSPVSKGSTCASQHNATISASNIITNSLFSSSIELAVFPTSSNFNNELSTNSF